MKKFLFVAVATLLTSNVVMAQEDSKKGPQLKSYNYFELQGGVDWTTTNAKIDKLLMPIGAFSFGHYFTPEIGARLHVSGLQAKGRFEDLNINYKWNYVTADADLLLNLSNIFSRNYARPLNVIFVGGVGIVKSWGHDDIAFDNFVAFHTNDKTVNNASTLDFGNKRHLTHNLRAGLRLETNVTKPFGVSLEIAANTMQDRFNGKVGTTDDWMISGMVGLSWRFGHSYTKPRKVVRQMEEVVWVEVPDTIIVKEKRTVTTEEHKKMEEAIFFKIRQSDADNAMGTDEAIKKVADLMKTSDDATFTITGYADKGTGNPRINKVYAQKRADDVAKKLTEVHGLDAARLKTDSKGDTVQPFEENDKNRCVIITGEGTFKVTNYEEYDVEKIGTKKVQQTVIRDVVVEEW